MRIMAPVRTAKAAPTDEGRVELAAATARMAAAGAFVGGAGLFQSGGKTCDGTFVFGSGGACSTEPGPASGHIAAMALLMAGLIAI